MSDLVAPPLARWIPVRSGGRWLAAGLLAISLGLVGVAAWLRPDVSPQQMGTHTQMGFAPCGFVFFTGYPCPSCGMTTACALTMHGRLAEAFIAQPAGLAVALAAILTTAISLMVLLTGLRPAVPAAIWMHPVRTVWLGAGLLVFGWAFKIIYGLLTGTLPMR